MIEVVNLLGQSAARFFKRYTLVYFLSREYPKLFFGSGAILCSRLANL